MDPSPKTKALQWNLDVRGYRIEKAGVWRVRSGSEPLAFSIVLIDGKPGAG